MRVTPIVAAVTLSLGTAACTSYTPITTASAPTGATVRITLNDAALLHSYGTVGSRVRTFYGKVRSASDTSLTLAVTDIERVDATREERGNDVVSVARADIASVEEEHTSVARSALAAGVIGGGLIFIGSQIKGSQGNIKTGGGPVAGN